LFFRSKKLFDARPTVGNQASPGSGGFKDTRGWRKAHPGHGIAVDIQHHARRAVHAVVIARANVADPADVGRKPLSAPTFSAKSELIVRSKFGCAKEKFLHAAFTVREAMTHK